MPPRKAEPSVDKSRILTAALAIAKKQGVSKLNLRALALALDVSVTAVERHVESREELIKLLRISVLESVPGLAETDAALPKKKVAALTEAQIIETALELVRRDGADALSMRGLAKHLGVSVMGLYHHVPSKEALLERLWTAVLSSVPLREPSGDRWEEDLREYAVTGVTLLAKYPGLMKYGISRPPTEIDLQFNKHGAEVLRTAGFDPQDAALATATFHMFLLGTVIVAERFHEMRGNAHGKTGFEALDRSRSSDLRAFVTFGAQTLIDGLRARLHASSAAAAGNGAQSKTPRL